MFVVVAFTPMSSSTNCTGRLQCEAVAGQPSERAVIECGFSDGESAATEVGLSSPTSAIAALATDLLHHATSKSEPRTREAHELRADLISTCHSSSRPSDPPHEHNAAAPSNLQGGGSGNLSPPDGSFCASPVHAGSKGAVRHLHNTRRATRALAGKKHPDLPDGIYPQPVQPHPRYLERKAAYEPYVVDIGDTDVPCYVCGKDAHTHLLLCGNPTCETIVCLHCANFDPGMSLAQIGEVKWTCQGCLRPTDIPTLPPYTPSSISPVVEKNTRDLAAASSAADKKSVPMSTDSKQMMQEQILSLTSAFGSISNSLSQLQPQVNGSSAPMAAASRSVQLPGPPGADRESAAPGKSDSVSELLKDLQSETQPAEDRDMIRMQAQIDSLALNVRQIREQLEILTPSSPLAQQKLQPTFDPLPRPSHLGPGSPGLRSVFVDSKTAPERVRAREVKLGLAEAPLAINKPVGGKMLNPVTGLIEKLEPEQCKDIHGWSHSDFFRWAVELQTQAVASSDTALLSETNKLLIEVQAAHNLFKEWESGTHQYLVALYQGVRDNSIDSSSLGTLKGELMMTAKIRADAALKTPKPPKTPKHPLSAEEYAKFKTWKQENGGENAKSCPKCKKKYSDGECPHHYKKCILKN